jgi:phosphoglycerate dehydrogenase-like enzyme
MWSSPIALQDALPHVSWRYFEAVKRLDGKHLCLPETAPAISAFMLRCAVLDDYQDIALDLADWSPVRATSFREHFATQDDLVRAVHDHEILVIMRERTPFPAELFARLPNLRLLITTGMRNASIDLGAARAHGVTVCGTAGSSAPPTELTWALILGLARHLIPEATALRAGGPWPP